MAPLALPGDGPTYVLLYFTVTTDLLVVVACAFWPVAVATNDFVGSKATMAWPATRVAFKWIVAIGAVPLKDVPPLLKTTKAASVSVHEFGGAKELGHPVVTGVMLEQWSLLGRLISATEAGHCKKGHGE